MVGVFAVVIKNKACVGFAQFLALQQLHCLLVKFGLGFVNLAMFCILLNSGMEVLAQRTDCFVVEQDGAIVGKTGSLLLRSYLPVPPEALVLSALVQVCCGLHPPVPKEYKHWAPGCAGGEPINLRLHRLDASADLYSGHGSVASMAAPICSSEPKGTAVPAAPERGLPLQFVVHAKSPRPGNRRLDQLTCIFFLQSCAMAVYFWSSNIRSVCLNRLAAAV